MKVTAVAASVASLALVGAAWPASAGTPTATAASSSTAIAGQALPRPTVTASFTSANGQRAALAVRGHNVAGAQSSWRATWTTTWIRPSAGQLSYAVGSCADFPPLPAGLERRYRVEAQRPGGAWFLYDSGGGDRLNRQQPDVGGFMGVTTIGLEENTVTSENRTLRLRFTLLGKVDGTQRVEAPTVFAAAAGGRASATAC